MEEILFFIFAFLTVFLSIKLSYYCDLLSKSFKVSSALVGGILLASVTSLPEFVTCFSSIKLNNPLLAIGDILGSNFFNIFMMSLFDIIFIKYMMFNKLKNNYLFYYLFLIISYIFIYLYMSGILSVSISYIGIPSIIILILYFIYFLLSFKRDKDDVIVLNVNKRKLIFKIIITSLFMIVSSILLTINVNKIAIKYPLFSSSLLGAILLGVTTSLPEVITFYSLVKLNNYDLALSNILGSNIFNLFVLAIGDFLIKGSSIFGFFDKDSFIILILGFIVTIINMVSNIKSNNKIIYILPSVVIFIIYILFWFFKFVY